MAARARKRNTAVGSNDGSKTKRSKRQVSKETFQKWQRTYEKEHQSMAWLRADMDEQDKSIVSKLWCVVCRKYETSICGLKNFSMAWIDGSSNHKTSNITDHANSDQHKSAMMHLRKDQAKSRNEPITSYSHIARSLLSSPMDPAVRERVEKKFDISFVLAKEHIPFLKYKAIHELEERHGVDLGVAYKNRDSALNFVHYIAESQRRQFHVSLASCDCHFYSVLMDGSTDKGRVENELFVILFCKRDNTVQEVRTCARYFCVLEPTRADADGLIESLSGALKSMGIENLLERESVLGVHELPVLVGCGTDGASVNVSGQNGMRGKVQAALPWLYWAWCYAHRLELACKDAFSSRLFHDIDDMLLRLYYLYEKSPKKCHELSDLIDDLKEVFELPEGGNLPVRANGSRWITYKRKALQRVVDRYGAYLNHLATLTEDASIKSTDRQRLKGYLLKWREARMIIGSALYTDALKPASLLSLTLQDDDINAVQGIKHILKSHSSLKKLTSQNPVEWPVTKVVLSRLKDENGGKVYQGSELHHFRDTTIKTCQDQALADLKSLDEQMRSRLVWSDVDLMRSILLFLDTQSWQDSEGSLNDDDCLSEVKAALVSITDVFRAPLEAKGVDLTSILDEIEDIVDYARTYLRIGCDSYKKVWYQLYLSPDAVKWPNILLVSELLFSLPFSTAKVERLFSTLKIIKNERRTNLSCSTLNDLLEVNTEGPTLSNFSADSAVDLWWSDSSSGRRVNQKPRKEYRRRKESSTHVSSDSEDVSETELDIDAWDNWFHVDEESSDSSHSSD